MRALKGHRMDAYLGDASLRAVDAKLWVNDIRQEITQKSLSSANAFGHGRRRQRIRREALRVTVDFRVLESADPAAREAVVEAANAWARDGILMISTKPGRRLDVCCAERASIREPRNPKETFSLVFETMENPFWEDVTPTTISLSGTTEQKTVSIPGSAETVADVTVTHASGTLNTLALTLGSSSISLSNLNIAAGTTLTLDHDENGYLRIKAGTASKYACRSGASDDDLLVLPGSRQASFTANVACQVTFSVRGRYQ